MHEISGAAATRRGRRRAEAAGGVSRAQLTRLFRLVVILQSERYPNARELAESCEVSRRTVHRDLELLEAAEIPVRYQAERQGYHLARGFFLPPTNLTEAEALGLRVLAWQWDAGDALGLHKHAWDGAVKLVEGLPPEVRERVVVASEPFRTVAPNETGSDERTTVRAALWEALTGRKQLRLWYRDPGSSDGQCTKLAVYRLVLHDRRWSLVGRSSLHRRVVVIGEPWVSKAEVTDDPSAVPPRFNLERYLGRAWGVDRGHGRHDVRVVFSARATPAVLSGVWHPSQRVLGVEQGRAEVAFAVDGLDEILKWVVGFGDDAEVLAPDELRERLHDVASRVAQAHAPHTPRLPLVPEMA